MLIRPATPADAAEIDALLDTAFGPGRHARTASLLRAGAMPIDGPSLVARGEGDELLGSIQYWPIALTEIPSRLREGPGVGECDVHSSTKALPSHWKGPGVGEYDARSSSETLPSHFWEGSGVGEYDVPTSSKPGDRASPPAPPPPSPLPEAGGGAPMRGGAPVEWRGAAGGAGMATMPLTLLGPVAVAPTARSIGLGRRLLAASLSIADAAGLDPILLIGDQSYYGPFGFTADATGGWTLPGPVERHRLLLRQRTPAPLPRVAAVVAAAYVATVCAAPVAAPERAAPAPEASHSLAMVA